MLLHLCKLSCMAKVILKFLWKPSIPREEEFEDTVHLILMFPVIFRARRQYYITRGCNKTLCFLLLPLQRRQSMTVWRQCSARSYRFHRCILSEPPSRRNIYTSTTWTSILLPLNAQGDDWKDSTINKEPEGCWEEYNMPDCLTSSSSLVGRVFLELQFIFGFFLIFYKISSVNS